MPTTTFNIASAADFNTALATINSGGANAAGNTTYTFNLTSGFTLDRNLAAINLLAGSALNIQSGSGVTINGNNAFSGFNAQSGSVNISHVTIVEMLARGADAPASPGGGGGGGAAGLGGGLFVGADADVTLSDVGFSGNDAVGGSGSSDNGGRFDRGAAGGGPNGGLGGDRFFLARNATPGTAGGFASGGGGGGTGALSIVTGEETSYSGSGGNGGYGGGGGGGGSGNVFQASVVDPAAGGAGGFGGGAGQGGQFRHDGSGGGGLGAGGAVFVQEGGTLTFYGTVSVTGGAVAGGSSSGGFIGSAFGSGLFLQGNQTLTFAPGAGVTQSLADVIADETGSGGGGVGATGVVRLVLDNGSSSGSGTLVLAGANTFTGGITIKAGTLELTHALGAGSGPITFATDAAGLLTLAAGITIGNRIAGFDGNDAIDLAGFAAGTTATFGAGDVVHVTDGLHSTTLSFLNAPSLYAVDDGHGGARLASNMLRDGDFQDLDLSGSGAGITVDPVHGNFTGAAPGWSSSSAGLFAPTAIASSFAGSNVAYLNGSATLTQQFTPLAHHDWYHVSLDLGRRADIGPNSATSGTIQIYEVSAAGTTLLGQQSFNTTSLAAGAVGHVSFDTNVAALAANAQIRFVITNSGTAQLLVDNVLIEPAPAVHVSLAQDTGTSATDRLTSITTLSGSGEANGTVTFTIDGNAGAATATVAANGTWSYTPTGLSDGTHIVIATETTAKGTGQASLTFTRDTTAPTIAITSGATVEPTSNPNLVMSGTVGANDSGTTVTIYDSGKAIGFAVPVLATGAWTANFAVSGDGAHVLTAIATDTAGNSTTASVTATLDTAHPTASIALVGPATQATDTPLQFAVTFSEAVTGVSAAAFSLSGNATSGAAITGVTQIDAAHYLVDVASSGAPGALELDITGASIHDLAGNGFGGGTLTFSDLPRMGTGLASVLFGDVDNDGKADLVATHAFHDNNIVILRGNGSGGYGALSTATVVGVPESAALGDVNGDGNLDIVTANLAGNTVAILIGNGDGTFKAPVTAAVGANPVAIVLADLDGDGRPDIVTANQFSFSLSVLHGNGDGTFQPQTTIAVSGTPYSVAVADLNGDGKLDVITAADNAGVTVRLGNGDGTFRAETFQQVGESAHSVAIGDLNRDGKLDIVAGNAGDGTVSILYGNGNGTFQPQVTSAAVSHPNSVVLADLNSDGLLDIVTTGSDFTSVIAFNNGHGTFQALPQFATGPGPLSPVADMNGDGRIDVVVANLNTSNPIFLLNSATPQSGPAFTLVDPQTFVIGQTVPADATYFKGQALDFTVEYNDTVTVTGTPRIALTLDTGGTVYADYLSGSGTDTLTFRHVVQAGEYDLTGIAVAAKITFGTGTIHDTGDIPVSPLLELVSTAGVKIDALAPVVLTVGAPADGTYDAGQKLTFTVNLSEAVTVNTSGGVPYIDLTLDTGGTVRANYLSGSGTSALVFQYQIVAGQQDGNGVALGADIIANGATLRDVTGVDANLTLNGIAPTAGVQVDALAPAVTAIDLVDAAANNLATEHFTVTFSRSVTGVTADDFALSNSGTATGTVASVTGSGTTWTVTVNGVTGDGTMGLDLKPSGTGIASTAGVAIASGFTGGETYSLDHTGPVIVITTPNGATNNFNQTITGTIGMVDAFQDISIYEGGTFLVSATPAPLTGAWSAAVRLLGLGANTITVKATDALGNVGSASVDRFLDVSAPATVISEAPSQISNVASAHFAFTAFDSGGSGLGGYKVSVDGGTVFTVASSLDLSGLSEGQHSLSAVAFDAAGNFDPVGRVYVWVVDTAAPDTTISASPPHAGTSADVSFSFAGSDPGGSGVASLQVQLDGGGFSAAVGSSQSYSALSEGSHTFQVRAIDRAGNVDATPASWTFFVDRVAPETQITARPDANSHSTTAAFNFTGLDGSGSGADHFLISIDGAAAVSTTNGSVTYTDLSEGGHSFAVLAVDAAGNADTTPAGYTWTVDTVAPETTITSTLPASVSSSADASFTFTGDAGTGTAIDHYEISWDGGAFAPTTDLTVGMSGLSEGPHRFAVRAVDLAGNVDATPARYDWVVDTIAPDTAIAGNPDNPTGSASALFSFSGDAGSGTAIDHFLYRIDDGDLVSTTGTTASLTGLSDGAHTFEVSAVDKAGNTDANAASYTWFVDTTEPGTAIVDKPAANSASTSATFTFTGQDFTGQDASGSGVDHFIYQVDGGPLASTVSGSASFAALVDGTHTFAVYAVDAAGNADTTPSAYTWTVDTIAPETTITAAPADPSNSADAIFTFAGDPGTGTAIDHFEISWDGAAYTPTTGSTASANLSEGAHTFAVVAVDRAGNIDATAATYAWVVDTIAPDAPPAPDLVPASDSGTSASDNITSNTTPTFTGTAEDGTTVTLYDGTTAVGSAAADGTWSITATTLGEGAHTISAKASDAAGNIGLASASLAVTIDTVAPTLAITSNVAQLKIGESATITFTFGEDPGATFAWDGTSGDVAVSGGSLGAISGTGLTRSAVFTPAAGTNGGIASITVAAGAWTDTAGNSGGAGAASLTYDTLAPDAASTPDLADGSDSGKSASDNITNVKTPTFTGTAEDGATVTLHDGATVVGSGIANGHWAIATSALADGDHTISATITDAAGNAGPSSGGLIVTIDTTPPAAPVIALTHDTGVSGADRITGDPAISYLAVNGSYKSDGGGFTAAAPVFAMDGSADGWHTVTIQDDDAAGNISASSLTFLLDTTAPVAQDGASSASQTVTGTLVASDNLSTSLSFSRVAQAAHGVVTVNTDGTFTYTPDLFFSGHDSFTFKANDGVADSNVATFNVDITATHLTGTPGDDSFAALPGTEFIDALGGNDTITFDFKLTDATLSWVGNTIIVDTATSHTVISGFEVFKFTDGTVNDNDGDPLVDDLFYYSQNHDVWTAGVDADTHYHTYGWHEGRDPDAFFSTSLYLTVNPDVKAAGVDPLIHFDQYGWREGRVPSITFDPNAYLAANPDVKAAGVDPLAHFLTYGAGEGRQPIAPSELLAPNGFDYVYYLQHNPDVAAAHVDAFQHFETIGWKEGRNPNADFDTKGYLAAYTDVAAAGINPLDHYNQAGWKEGRDPSGNFDTTDYLSHYTDVANAHINPLIHFLQFGQAEGRSPFADGHFG